VNTSDCSVNWKYKLGTGDLFGGIYASCAVSPFDGTVYVGALSKLYAMNPDGTLQWSYGVGDDIVSSAVVATDGTIYVGCDDTHLYAVNADGSLKWSYKAAIAGKIISSPALGADGTVYVGCQFDEKLHAVNPADGTLKWSFDTGDNVQSSPAVGSDGTIYIGSDDDYLYAVNSNGSLKWSYDTGDDVLSSPAVDDVRGMVYVGSNSDSLFAIDTAGTRVWATHLDDDVRFSSPAVASVNNMIYIGDFGGHFYVIDGSNGTIACKNSHWQEITSPAIDDPASNGGSRCVWYNEYCVAIYKVCCTPVGTDEESSQGRSELYLNHCPNPLGVGTTISFSIPVEAHVVIDIYDITGRLMQKLANETYSAGNHAVDWDAENLREGIYFCKLTAGTRTLTRKLIVTK
jgi:outer membrane protein assembly factor BamB